MAGFCECGNELRGYIICGEFLYYVRKDCAPLSYYCENLTKQINALCGEYVEIYNIKKKVKHKRV